MKDRLPTETELKLLFPPEARAQLDAHPALQAPPEEQHLVSTYYDTPELALAAAGLTLRVRSNGRQRIQTVKSKGEGGGLAPVRGEWEWPVEAGRPDFALLAGSPPGAGLRPELADRLEPVFVTDIRRSVRRLSLDGAEVEAALDQGSIRAGEASEPVCELELELKDGPVGPLYRLALALHGAVPLHVGVEPKAARGYRLRTGRPAEVEKARDPDLGRRVRGADGLRQMVATALGGLLGNRGAAGDGDAEGVHQMRVGIRRLRAALVLFAPHLEPHAAARFERELKRLGRVLGEARDWDVFCLETLPAALPGDAEASWRRLIEPPAQAARQAAHERLHQELAGPALTGLALALSAWVEEDPGNPDGDLDRRLSALAPALLDRLARKAARRGRHVERLPDEALHALRKSLKKLRYGADYLAGLYPAKAVKATLKPCKALQELLGIINDAATAETLAEALGGADLDLAPALGAVARWAAIRRHDAQHHLPAAWHAFRAASAFWH